MSIFSCCFFITKYHVMLRSVHIRQKNNKHFIKNITNLVLFGLFPMLSLLLLFLMFFIQL